MATTGESKRLGLRDIPSVDEVLRVPDVIRIRGEAGESRATTIVRRAVELLRCEMLAGEHAGDDREVLLRRLAAAVADAWSCERGRRTRRVINASGVVIHTNLGRAPLSAAAIEAVAREASGYCTVEYDLETGGRGRRGERSEALLCQITGAEAALIVNNCAAAAFLVLSVLAAGREVVISRGEMVEIGGDFRIPDVLTRSGAVLREVGTTNRTKIVDFQRAVNERTAMLLRVHPSNYRITGFTEMPSLSAMAEVARAENLILYEDAGSGAVSDVSSFGPVNEPLIAESVAAGADVVTFSGDKLLGGPQAGLVVGRRELIEKLRQDPLYRALRASKLIYAALEATLEIHLRPKAAEQEIPVLRMLSTPAESIKTRAAAFAEKISKTGEKLLAAEVINGKSVVGGGASPDFQPATHIIAVRPTAGSAAALERSMRSGEIPVVARLHGDRVLIDLRTVDDSDEIELLAALAAAAQKA